jgi:hypothetical protein
MISLTKVVKRIEARLAELGTSAAEISAQATDSKDTIRNWIRAVEADQKNGTDKASATTIKLNQVEKALGIELARDVDGETPSPEARLRSSLLAYGIGADDLNRVIRVINGFLGEPDEQPSETPLDDRSAPANRRREEVPSR